MCYSCYLWAYRIITNIAISQIICSPALWTSCYSFSHWYFFVFILLDTQCRVNMIDMMKKMSYDFLVYFKLKTIYLLWSFWTEDLWFLLVRWPQVLQRSIYLSTCNLSYRTLNLDNLILRLWPFTTSFQFILHSLKIHQKTRTSQLPQPADITWLMILISAL